jgi:hypothetical protein
MRKTSIGSNVSGRANVTGDAKEQSPLFSVTSENEATAVGQIEVGWAYEMHLLRQNGCWVVTQLRVFPGSDNLNLQILFNRTLYSIELGDADEAARWARELAHFVLSRPRQELPVPVQPGGLTARHLRRVPFGRHAPAAMLKGLDAASRKIADSYRRLAARGGGDVKLARIAGLYAEALKRRSKRQNADVARQLGMKVSQVRDAIHLARRKGLLSSTRKQGVPGGELTPRAVEMLQIAESTADGRRTSRNASRSKHQPTRKAARHGHKNRN